MHFVAIAVGSGIESWHWRTAKPYQPASLLQASGCSLLDESIQELLRDASPSARRGFATYLSAWQANQRAQAKR